MSFQDPGGAQADDTAAGGGPPPAPPPGPGGPGGPPPPGGGALPFLRRGPQPSAPGPGDQAAAMTQIQNAIGLLQAAMSSLQPGSPQHRDVVRAVQSLSRHMAQGQPTAGVQVTQIQDLLRNLMKNALLTRITQQQQQGGQGQQAGQGQGGPAPPMPSTPLPGA